MLFEVLLSSPPATWASKTRTVDYFTVKGAVSENPYRIRLPRGLRRIEREGSPYLAVNAVNML